MLTLTALGALLLEFVSNGSLTCRAKLAKSATAFSKVKYWRVFVS